MLAIITDSTCDLTAAELERLNVHRVPLYVNFQGKMHHDWIDINPGMIISGVQGGAALPTTSQPSPEDFTQAYQSAIKAGASEILVVTITSGMSGTYQSANLAAKDCSVPVSIVDSENASAGIAVLVRQAVKMREAGADRASIVSTLEAMRAHMGVFFSVGTLEFLQKGGRIGRAQALLGGLLNVRPILTLEAGKIAPAGKARGVKKTIAELVDRVKAHASAHSGELVIDFLHIQEPDAVETFKQALRDAGVSFTDSGTIEIGAVIAAHVGPGTFGAYLHIKPS
jgi:DegV family protein with EDD domain